MGNDLDPRLSPVQRFGRELARVRREARLSQARLAAHLGVSSSLVGHIEIGDRNPNRDLAARCDVALRTGDLFSRLYRNIASPSSPIWFVRWLDDIEPRARALRSWDPLLVPGLLQTEEYARAVFEGGRAAPPEEIEQRVLARVRRKQILEQDRPPELWVLIDEWVLKRPLGNAKVMRDQLDYLTDLAERRHITVQVVPYDSPCTDGLLSSFTIAELPDAPTAVSIESAGKGEVSSEHDLVTDIWGQYDRLRAQAFRPIDSLEKIREARAQWNH
ncbi:helix-turn-helix domain-containing protein [Sphaerisporangium dianthi]|uniref:Scr1 family TA system antitoxin-like transcriptional regulator n=1 Tax=Sphaerisporangium dianthi TaxID=1436120 RepID=A0ABV9CDM3_9ACTN